MRSWMAVLLLAPMLSGCLTFLEPDDGPDRAVGPATDVDDPSLVTVTGVRVHGDLVDPREQLVIPSTDGTALSAIIYEPLSQQALPDGRAPTWPVVVFLHGWGMTKEMWVCAPLGDPAPPAGPDAPCPYTDLLDQFARAGIIAVAYDARGFGRSGGQSTAAGPAEMADLRAVIDFTTQTLPTNGKVGVTGVSYGGGQSLLAWATEPRITTAVPHQGWYDLYEALLPGNTPKGEWAAMLLGEGTVMSGAQLHPMVYEWSQSAVSRQNLPLVEAQMDARSIANRTSGVDKPLMLCMAMHDSLFTQTGAILGAVDAFTRTVIHEGGHGTMDAGCWDKTIDWFSFFLRGVDTQVDAWPAVQSTDIAGGNPVRYFREPSTDTTAFYLRDPQLTEFASPNWTFQFQNQAANNPLQEPGAVWDMTGQPPEAIPFSMRNDPSALFFETAPLDDTFVVLGSARLALVPAAGTENTAWQATAQLIHVMPDGNSRIIARGAYTNLPGQTEPLDGPAILDFSFTRAQMQPGSMLVLKLGANDLSWFLPYPGSYTVSFTGASELSVPFFG